MRTFALAFALFLAITASAAAAPTVSLTSSTPNPVAGQPVEFTASWSFDPPESATPITKIDWDWTSTGGFDQTVENPSNPSTNSHIYPNAGEKIVKVRITDDAAVPYEATLEINVAAANQPPVAGFTFSPSSPITDQEVLFEDDNDSSDPDGSIVKREWDLDGDDDYDENVTGPRATRSFQFVGDKTVRLRVTDDDGAQNVRARTVRVVAPPPNKLPVVQFSVTPQSPTVGDQVALRSFSYDPDGSIKEQRWDLDGDGDFSENVAGATAFTTFFTAGPRIVRLRVTDNDGGVQTDTVEITVKAAPAVPPPVTSPTTPGTTPPTTTPKAKLSLLGSSALVRLAGSATMKTTRVQILQVRAPRQSIVEVRCSGKGCPTKSVRKRVKSKPLRFDILERSLRAGTVLTVFIRKSGYVGKYTSFLLRPGKAPKRTDGCVMPGKTKRVRCPAA